MHASTAKYFEDVDLNYWVQSHLYGQMYDILTTNIVESTNALMKEPRKFHITQLIHHFRLIMQ